MAEFANAFPGARFYKTDLHIHTPASACWKGRHDAAEMKRIFERLKEQGMEVVAITDHNTVTNVNEAKKLGKQLGIHVYPGVEVSTKEGHVLAIFDPAKATRQVEEWLARMGITESVRGNDKTIAKAQDSEPLSITKVFNLIEREDGVAIAPHPHSKGTGFLEVLKQKGIARQEAYDSPHLRGLEVGKNREKVLRFALGTVTGYPKKYGCVANSDAHTVDEIGTAFTYIKLGDFGIGALKQVFYDPAMRIRFSEQWPPISHAWIERLEVSQGFFDGVKFRFHPDMNCLVGGKAVGKSLLIELIRFALGVESPIKETNEESKSKVWAATCLGEDGTVILHVISEEGERYRIERTVSELDAGPEVYYGDTQTKASQAVSNVFDCKIYSQNEVIELGKRLPALLDWLDGFVDLSAERKQIEELTKKMESHLEKLDKAHAIAVRQKELEIRKRELEAKRKLLEDKVKEPILKQFPKWQKEERHLVQLQDGLDALLQEVVEELKIVRVEDYVPEAEPDTPNYRDIAAQRESLIELNNDFQQVAATLKQALRAKAKSLRAYVSAWRRKFVRAREKHEGVIKSAGVKNASALTSELNKVTEAIESIKRKLKRVKKAARQKAALESALRGTLMPDYNACFANIYKKRMDKAAEITDALNGFVRIQVRQMAERSDFEKALAALAKGSGLRRPVLQQIVAKVTPVELAEYIVDRNSQRLAEKAGINKERASVLIEHAWATIRTEDGDELLSDLYDIVFTELRDLVLVELRVDGDVYKPMQELSDGSKCTAILSVALVEWTCPLIVDQPEDALDNPFVFEQIVQTVRRSKAGRQYLFATHNPNVAVASDADLIYCLKATARQGSIDKYGSIDEISTRDRVVANLEGGRDAFRLRSQKYDIVVEDANAVVLDLPRAE